jgi:RND family efflux transporter MFP subunit
MANQILRGAVIAITLTLVGPLWALSLNGVTQFGQTVQINPRSAGVISEVRVAAGDRVSRGDVLLVQDSTLLQGAHDRALGLHQAARPELQNAMFEFERAQELYDRDSLSELELRKAEMALNAAQGRVDAAAAEVRMTRYQLDQSTLRAPVSALVLEVNTNPGRQVDPAVDLAPLVSLAVTRPMVARVMLTSEQWDPALKGKKINVNYSGKSYTGKVVRLGHTRVEQSGGFPAYLLEVSFNPDQPIPAHMPVSLQIDDIQD